MVIQGGAVDLHIRVGLLQGGETLRRGDDAHELDVLHAAGLELADGIDGGAAGGQHRVEDDDLTAGDVVRELAVVLHRQGGLRVAIEADVAHFGGGHQLHHTVHHTEARPQDRHKGEFAPGDDAGLGDGHRGLDLDFLERKIPGGLITEKHGDLGDELPEFLGAGVLIPQQRELVLDQRMVGDEGGDSHSKNSFREMISASVRRRRQSRLNKSIIAHPASRRNRSYAERGDFRRPSPAPGRRVPAAAGRPAPGRDHRAAAGPRAAPPVEGPTSARPAAGR